MHKEEGRNSTAISHTHFNSFNNQISRYHTRCIFTLDSHDEERCTIVRHLIFPHFNNFIFGLWYPPLFEYISCMQLGFHSRSNWPTKGQAKDNIPKNLKVNSIERKCTRFRLIRHFVGTIFAVAIFQNRIQTRQRWLEIKWEWEKKKCKKCLTWLNSELISRSMLANRSSLRLFGPELFSGQASATMSSWLIYMPRGNFDLWRSKPLLLRDRFP